MQQTPNQPLYAAKDRVPFNLTLVLALGIAAWGAGAVFGLWDMGGNPSVIFLLGIAVAIYTWLFTPREYLVYADAVCVAYGKPRVKVIHFSNIATVEMGSLATLDQLRIRPIKGRRQSVRVREPEAFFDELENALNTYRNEHPEENVSIQFTGRRPPEMVEGDPVVMADADAPDAVVATDGAPPVEDAPEAETAAPEASLEADSDEAPAEEQAEPASQVAEGESVTTEQPEQGDGQDDEEPQQPSARAFY